MFRQPFFLVFGEGRRLFGVKIVVYQYGMAFNAEPPLLPGLVVHGKRFGPNPADPRLNLYLVLEVQLVHIVIIRVGNDEREGFAPECQRRIEYPQQRIARKFEPNHGNGIVDVPQYVHVPKTGVYCCYKHKDSIAEM